MPLIVTEPYFNFSTIQEGMTEIFFEEYEFQALLRTNGKLP
jgi:actin-related protein 6